MDDDVSGKSVYEWLLSQGHTRTFPPCEEGRFLLIRSLCMREETAESFRRAGRVMSGRRGDPLSFYSNPSGGAHCGFFVRRGCSSFDQVRDWFDSLRFEIPDPLDGEDVRPCLGRLIDVLVEMDPDEEYGLYLYDQANPNPA